MSDCYRRDGSPCSAQEWVVEFETCDRVIVQTDLPNGYFVSTVWLGLDHAWGMLNRPLIFETMVFPGNDCRRYSTETEARIGHAAMVADWATKPQAPPDED